MKPVRHSDLWPEPRAKNVIKNDRRGSRMAGAILLVFAACGSIALGNEQPPDIVLIVADDLGWGDVGFNGRTEWSTPNLDRLAGQGVVLKRCYSAATVCAPSRAAFLTGKYTIHSGVRRNDEDLPAEEVTIAEALRVPWLRHGALRQVASRQAARRSRSSCSPDGPGVRRVLRLHRCHPSVGEVPQDPLGRPAGRSRSQDTSTICSPTDAIDFVGRTAGEALLSGNRLCRKPFPHRRAGRRSRAIPGQVPGIRPRSAPARNLRGDGHPAGPEHRSVDRAA